jgi:hypothetical protein
MNLLTTKIILTKPKNPSEPLTRDRERLSMQKPMKILGFTLDMEIGIESGDHFLITITIHSHNGGHPISMANIYGLIDYWDVE